MVFGGSFCDKMRDELYYVIVEDVFWYLNWLMGLKIIIDFVIMMNKGLEVIEVYWFFGIFYE